ncbi:hypothetical protein A6769_28640 [Nostoc punctiforme NIES-2108]|uniref:Glucose-methanol-choline oxidoreductase N-terminal domain-containing protein n=1 Tax=Nostoc punctiforme NIES-2108 TaxID=1356359 RepID=A0A367R6J9_NOSPU|nr:hypothetical protein A6769_28640 [Nostoc punctiforme NIES-2108]
MVEAGAGVGLEASILAASDQNVSILLLEAGGTPDNEKMWTPSDWFEVLQKCPEIEWGYQ